MNCNDIVSNRCSLCKPYSQTCTDVEKKKKYRKIRLAQRKTIKKVASETAAAGTTVISRIREQCRNSCMYATMHVKKLKRSGAIRRKRLFDTLQPHSWVFRRWLSLTYFPGSFIFLSFVSPWIFSSFQSPLFFFSLLSLLATYPRFIYSHLLASSIVTRPRRKR